jgi:apolipoprotein N-acyltransferase
MNFWIFNWFKDLENSEVNVPQKEEKNQRFFHGVHRNIKIALLCFVALYAVSLLLIFSVNVKEGKAVKVAVLQPSFDPWTEKFVRDPMSMEDEMIDLSLQTIDSSVEWLLWPETSLVDAVNLKFVENDYQIQRLKFAYLLSKSPQLQGREAPVKLRRWGQNLQILSGVNGVNYYISDEKPTKTARKLKYEAKGWYDHYNSAIWLDSGNRPKFYHKSKLVPGTEQMPFIHYLPFLESLALQLDENSTTGSLAKNDSVDILGRGEKVAPIICYESIYGDLVREFVNKGAGWIGVVTNDAWWRETAGYQQHYSYSRLRAIETRKWVARSANTGTSGFIDPTGQEYQHSDWFKKVCLTQTIYSNHSITVYTRIGDLGVLFLLGMIIICLTYYQERKRIA